MRVGIGTVQSRRHNVKYSIGQCLKNICILPGLIDCLLICDGQGMCRLMCEGPCVCDVMPCKHDNSFSNIGWIFIFWNVDAPY